MDKNSLVRTFAENEEEELVFSHILDLAERSWSRSTVEAGNFLSDSQRMRAEKMLTAGGYHDFFFFGGYPDAERTCAVFCTEYCDETTIKENPSLAEIGFIKSELDKFNKDAELSHRDVLGSLMGLGIERDAVGDITLGEGFAVFAVKEAISPFVMGLERIGRYPVKTTSVDNSEMKRVDDFEECFDTVASLRLDAVVASLFSTSRSIATEGIEAGLVTLDGVVCKKVDTAVIEKNKISFRGKGRAEIEKLDGLSKKGRVRILFKRWK